MQLVFFSSKANIRDDHTYVQKILLFFLMGKIGLPRLRSVVFRTGVEIGLTPLCTLTIGFRQDTSCLFNPTAPCTPSHAFTHSLKRLFTTCRVFSPSFTGKTPRSEARARTAGCAAGRGER